MNGYFQRGRRTSPIKMSVRERDGNRCVDCGFSPGAGQDNLHVHRLIPGSQYTVDGCIAVCPKCHARRHQKPGNPPRKATTPKPTASIQVYGSARLKDLIGEAADKEGFPLSEYVARVMAEHLGHPELKIVPRKSIGRPRNKSGLVPA
jgi:hypothetical protein